MKLKEKTKKEEVKLTSSFLVFSFFAIFLLSPAVWDELYTQSSHEAGWVSQGYIIIGQQQSVSERTYMFVE